MGVNRFGPAHRADDRELAEGVVEMVVAADHVGHAHVVVVDHHRQHVGRAPVRAEQDEIVELYVLNRDPALDLVVDRRFALARGLEPDDEGLVALLLGDVAPRAFDAERPALGLGPLALRGEFFLRHVAAIGVAATQHLVGDFRVAGPELRLVIFVAVPIEPEPAHAVEDRVDRLGGRAGLVGIFDAQQELAAMVAGVEPVEQGRARAPDVQKTGRGGRETGDDGGMIACAQARFPLLFMLQCNGRAPLT